MALTLYSHESPADCSSATSLCMPQPGYHSTDEITPYDIFLSHSGKQKGFVKDLHRVLSPNYRTFFDITPHCLPAGKHFTSRIFDAAKTCRVAVVVLSEDFICSKWPMLELCSFTDNRITILPLFYQLLPEDLKLEENLNRWEKVWKGHAKGDAKNRIDVRQWARAVRELQPVKGVIYDESKGTLEYLDKIESAVLNLLSPSVRCDDKGIYGKDRLCKIILDTLEDMERHADPSKAFVLGLYGPSGSGKSTLSLFLRDHFRRYSKRVLHLKLLPSGDGDEELVKVLKQLLQLTDFAGKTSLDTISEPRDVIHLLKEYNFHNLSVCLVVDNIHWQSIRAVRKILLELGVGAASKVILVAQSPDVLRDLRGERYMFKCVSMPPLVPTEALQILLDRVQDGVPLDACAIHNALGYSALIQAMASIDSEISLIVISAVAEKVLRHFQGKSLFAKLGTLLAKLRREHITDITPFVPRLWSLLIYLEINQLQINWMEYGLIISIFFTLKNLAT